MANVCMCVCVARIPPLPAMDACNKTEPPRPTIESKRFEKSPTHNLSTASLLATRPLKATECFQIPYHTGRRRESQGGAKKRKKEEIDHGSLRRLGVGESGEEGRRA